MRGNIFSNSLGSFAFPPEINMSAPKGVLVVFGATGNQGGSVIQAILADPVAAAQTQIHAITRDPTKPAAVALTKKGVIVLKVCLKQIVLRDATDQHPDRPISMIRIRSARQ
jgi:hypothetical protein